MSNCVIADEKYLLDLIVRYNGIGRPITNDEREILLFALYNESEGRDGLAKRGYRCTAERAAKNKSEAPIR